MRTSCPNCRATSFEVPIKDLHPWERTKCKSCQALVEARDTIVIPIRLRLISVSADDDEGDD